MNTVDVKKMLGNPKITFVLGKDNLFRSTICNKLVEEYGYKYISTENLIEIENQKSKKKVSEGNMSYEAIVALLVNALIANPSKNYLIDGFPSSGDQAIYFEQNVCECQTVLYFKDQKHEEANEGEDRKEEADEATDSTLEVIEKYKLFGKVREIDSSLDADTVLRETKRALLPEVFFLLGPKASGKSTIGKIL